LNQVVFCHGNSVSLHNRSGPNQVLLVLISRIQTLITPTDVLVLALVRSLSLSLLRQFKQL
jgi:hypothetical protein